MTVWVKIRAPDTDTHVLVHERVHVCVCVWGWRWESGGGDLWAGPLVGG